MGIGFDWGRARDMQNRRIERQADIGEQYANRLADMGFQERGSGLQDAALSRRLQEQSAGLERDRFGLESELSRGRLGMQGNLANALAQALGQRQQFGGAMDVPPWMAQRGQMQAQGGQGMGLRDETRNYLMRFLKG